MSIDSSSDEKTVVSLREAIEHLETSTDFLQHRLDTIQSQLDVHTFSLESMRIRVLKSTRTSALRKLLGLLEINEKTLTMGVFLTRLNRYLVQNDFIDLNDLYIRISPLLSIVFHFPPGTRKVPYSFLLKELKNLFV